MSFNRYIHKHSKGIYYSSKEMNEYFENFILANWITHWKLVIAVEPWTFSVGGC